MWPKRNASSPANAAASGRTSSLRTSVCRWPATASRLLAGSSRDRAPPEHPADRPTPARRPRARSAPSRSRRAASSALIVGGIARSREVADGDPAVAVRRGRGPVVDQHAEQLLDEQRVALGGRRRCAPATRRRDAPPSRFAISCRLASGGSGSSRIDARVAAARRHSRPLARAARGGPSRAAGSGRRSLQPTQVLDEVEQRRLGPVDVVEDDDQRPIRARAPRSSRRTAQNVSSHCERARRQAERAGDPRRDEASPPRLARSSARACARASSAVVGFPDAGGRLGRSPRRPVRDALAVRQAAAAEHRAPVAARRATNSRDEPRLADARRRRATVTSRQRALSTAPARRRSTQRRELALAPDERRVEPSRGAGGVRADRDAGGRRRPARPCP